MKNLIKNNKILREKIPLYYYLLKNESTPKLAKSLIIGLIIYLISPLDIIPDTIPVLGLADDIALFPLFAYILTKIVPEDIWQKSKDKTDRLWFNSKTYMICKIIFLVLIAILAFIFIRSLLK
ncbi:MAG: DUF1232 domain-containing protein [Peptoniphilaceae bacterium]|nr:DUF1232 domain-containing protein [Peptoniphilaceae bacterium]MDY6018624.1 DUF1232 domain-containing protein [Anaerococcus sp.]